jgi:hypothetical protein
VLFCIAATVLARAADTDGDYRFSYYANGRICADSFGTLDGRNPVTVPQGKGQEDFKPSWSKTGDMLVFFRRAKNDPVVTNWKTILCVIKTDGTGFQMLTDDKNTNFNPTWTRDGKNVPIWNRKHPLKGHFFVMRSEVGNKPGQEEAISDHLGAFMPDRRQDPCGVRAPETGLWLLRDDAQSGRRFHLRADRCRRPAEKGIDVSH